MSYSCEISFKSIKAKDVYNFLVCLKQKLLNSYEKIAKDNCFYAPFLRYQHTKYTNLEKYSDIQTNYSWVKQIFSYRYFYLKDYNLLGIYGLPHCVHEIFDNTIYFQNSTDQDYPFNTWNKISLFKSIAKKWKNYNNERISEMLELDKDIEDIDYYRKSGCYLEIWDNYLSTTLYDDSSVVYFSCLGYYDLDFTRRFLVRCEEELIKKGFLEDDID